MKSTNSITILGLILLSGNLFGACNHPDDFPQFARDQILAYGLYYNATRLFSFTMTGQPAGSHNFDADCPQGGTVHIEGTSQVGSTVAVDITYDMHDCRFENIIIMDDLMLNGKLHHTVNYDSAGLGGEDLFAENLRMEGILYGGPDLDGFKQQCDIEISYIESDISLTLLGLICGRDVGMSLWHVTYEGE